MNSHPVVIHPYAYFSIIDMYTVKTDPKKLFKTLAISISSVAMDPSMLLTDCFTLDLL